jgi:RimJ/RimL family protein N-acetyltransferase
MDYAEAHCVAVRASIQCLKTWFTWASADYCLCDSVRFIEDQPSQEQKGKYSFAIFGSDDDEFLGSCGLTKVKTYNGEPIASMSYWRRQDTVKRDVIRAAWEEIKQEASKLDIARIEIDVAKCNQHSIRVAKKIGAKHERDIQIRGGDGKMHEGTRYVITEITIKA